VVEDWCNPDGSATVHPKNTSLIGSLLTSLSNNLNLGPGPSHSIGVNGKLPSEAGKPGQSDQWKILKLPSSTFGRWGGTDTFGTRSPIEHEGGPSGIYASDVGDGRLQMFEWVPGRRAPDHWDFEGFEPLMNEPEGERRDSIVE